MKTYLVQDSDWEWLSQDGDAVVIHAATPEDAAIKWCVHWDAIDSVDGACVKVAEVKQDFVVMVSKTTSGRFEIDKE